MFVLKRVDNFTQKVDFNELYLMKKQKSPLFEQNRKFNYGGLNDTIEPSNNETKTKKERTFI